MPNPVAANDLAPISGSLQTSRVSYGVDLKGKNYGQNYNGIQWYSDIPNDGTYYTIVSDNYTANYYISRSLAGGAYVEGGQPAVDEFSAPVFWTTQGTSSADIIATVNGLPDRKGQTPFTTGEQALNWIASSNNYFAIGPDYFKQIDGDNLGLYLDAHQIISYPTTESTWYDISGQSNEFTLLNGLDANWNSEGWFDFDGTDDYATSVGNVSNLVGSSNISTECLILFDGTLDSNDRKIFHYSKAGTSNGVYQVRKGTDNTRLLYQHNNGGTWYTSTITNAISAGNVWYHFVFIHEGSVVKTYRNGDLVRTDTLSTLDWSDADNLLLGYRTSAEYWKGNIANFKTYPKALTEAEVLQNYYGGPIVTDGLVFHVDANKLLSYSTVTGPNWFDMSNTMQPTQLLNGVTWSPRNGGVFIFDGTDDYGNNPDPLFEIPENVTINAWIKESSTGAAVGNYMAKANNNGYRMRRQGGASGDPLWIYSSGNAVSGGNIYNDVWHMVTGVFSDTGLRAYIDGELVASNSTPYTPSNLSSNDMFIGAYSPGSELFGGEMAMAQTYNRALTTQEIQQIYNATK